MSLGGEQVGTTGVDGTTTVSLPLADSARVGVSQYGQTRTATVSGLYTNLALVVAGALAALLAAVALARRYGLTPRRIAAAIVGLGQFAVGALVALGGLVDRSLRRLHRRLVLTAAHLRALVAGRVSPAALLAALREWLDDRSDAVQASFADGVESVTAAVSEDEAGPADAHATIREGWGQFLGHVSVARPERRTPEAIAAHAVETDDLPAEAVWTIVEAFRDVEYGQREPTDRLAAVDDALAEIERAATRADDSDNTGADGQPGVAD